MTHFSKCEYGTAQKRVDVVDLLDLLDLVDLAMNLATSSSFVTIGVNTVRDRQTFLSEKRTFVRKYAFASIFQTLQDLHTFAPLQSQNFRKRSV